jgi:hypothetical protein
MPDTATALRNRAMKLIMVAICALLVGCDWRRPGTGGDVEAGVGGFLSDACGHLDQAAVDLMASGTAVTNISQLAGFAENRQGAPLWRNRYVPEAPGILVNTNLDLWTNQNAFAEELLMCSPYPVQDRRGIVYYVGIAGPLRRTKLEELPTKGFVRIGR